MTHNPPTNQQLDEIEACVTGPLGEESHVVADDSDDPEHIDDCPGCEAFSLTGHVAAIRLAVETGA